MVNPYRVEEIRDELGMAREALEGVVRELGPIREAMEGVLSELKTQNSLLAAGLMDQLNLSVTPEVCKAVQERVYDLEAEGG